MIMIRNNVNSETHVVLFYCTCMMCTNQLRILLFQAGEALGAIGSPDVVEVLRKFMKDDQIEVHFLTI